MNAWKPIVIAALAALAFIPATAAADGKRPRPSDVPGAETSVAPNGFQIYNDFASPERTYSSARVVVHYVVVGIDAPPLNDDAADGVPDYVERVGTAADEALAYYERRGFRLPLPDEAGPDERPDVYISRFVPGTLGVSFPADRASGGGFAVVSNNLDPSAGSSFASLYATVVHELFHLTQFAYFGAARDPEIPTWILEGSAAAMESRVYPDLDDLVSLIQMRPWFSAPDKSMTAQSYGAQLLWHQLDVEQPRFLPALFTSLAARPVAGEGEHRVAAIYARVAGKPFAQAFRRYAVSIAADDADRLTPDAAPHRAVLPPLSVEYVAAKRSTLTVRFPRFERSATATLVYRLEGNPGQPSRTRTVSPVVGDGGRTLTFDVATGEGKTALLVISNGGEHPVAYAVSAR
jgi:hypothetical protein